MQVLLLPLGRLSGDHPNKSQTPSDYSSEIADSSPMDYQKITQSAVAMVNSAPFVQWNDELPILVGGLKIKNTQLSSSLSDNQKQVEMYILGNYRSIPPKRKRKCIPKGTQRMRTNQNSQPTHGYANQIEAGNYLQQQQRNIPVYRSLYDLDVVRKLYSRHRNWFIPETR